MFEYFINLASSAYFALGAVTVTIIIYVLVIIPIMNHMKQLDKVVMDKLSLLPTTDTYSTLFQIITDQNVFNEGLLKEYENVKNSVIELSQTIRDLNTDNEFVQQKINDFMEQMRHLEMSLEDYAAHLEFNDDRSSRQINSLVKARIDMTTFLIKLMDSLKATNQISPDFDGTTLYEIREELRVGAESIKNMNYHSSRINPRSGSVDKLTDFEY